MYYQQTPYHHNQSHANATVFLQEKQQQHAAVALRSKTFHISPILVA
jgi:hypothetical protein